LRVRSRTSAVVGGNCSPDDEPGSIHESLNWVIPKEFNMIGALVMMQREDRERATREALAAGMSQAEAEAAGERASRQVADMTLSSGIRSCTGAATGVAIGTALCPGIGTALGFLIGSFWGAASGAFNPNVPKDVVDATKMALKQ
jgi:hypothetical protein